MKKMFHVLAAIGLSVTGVAATTILPAASAEAQSWRGDGPRYDRGDRGERRGWRDDRGWQNNRGWRDDRGRRGDNWRAQREARVARAYDRARRTPGYVDPRTQGDYTNYTGRGSGYRPCNYVRQNGRTLCR
jgi:hypothetical protein